MGTLEVLLTTLSAPAASAQTSCDSSTPVVVHYQVSPQPSGTPDVSSLQLTGFPTTCNGDLVVLQLWGNAAGDPTLPQSDDSLLSTSDSALDPCTQAPLASPLTVASGQIDLALCPTGGLTGDVSVHDLTLLVLDVNGAPVSAALGGATTLAPAVAPKTASGRGGGILAFTGSNIVMILELALLATVIGVVLLVVGRRLRDEGADAAAE